MKMAVLGVIAHTMRRQGGGYLDCLKYAHENGCPWNEYTCMRAAKGGHLHCLIYLYENGCPLDKKECLTVANRYNNAECIKYLNSIA
jgi:hypothetical protein